MSHVALLLSMSCVCAQAAGRQVSGTVRNDATGRPVAGAEVRLIGEYRFRGETKTDTAGHFEIGGVPDNIGRGVIVARKGGLVSPLTSVRRESGVDLHLVPEAILTGVVREQEPNKPIAGATVTIRPYFVSGLSMSATSGKDGRFELTGIPPGRYVIAASHEAFFEARQRPLIDSIEITLESGRPAFFPFEMRKTAAVKGRVVDRDGAPAAGVEVRIPLHQAEPWSSAPYRTSTTDERGRFVIRTAAMRAAVPLTASCPTRGIGTEIVKDLTDGEVREDVTVRLWGTMHLRGVVTDQTGKPIPLVKVVENWNWQGGGDTTDTRGAFDLGRLPMRPPPADHFQVNVGPPLPEWKPEYVTCGDGRARIAPTLEEPGRYFRDQAVPVKYEPGKVVDLKVVLEEAELLTFFGRVTDHAGAPVGRANLVLLPGSAGPREVDHRAGLEIVVIRDHRRAISDEFGRWLICLKRDDLEAWRRNGWLGDPERLTVAAEGPGRALALVNDVTLGKKETRKELTLRLAEPPRMGRVSGRVVDTNGGAFGGAEVRTVYPAARVMSGPDGRFALKAERDTLGIWVRAPGFSVVWPKCRQQNHFDVAGAMKGVEDLKIVVARNGSAVVTVRWAAGQPVTECRMWAITDWRDLRTADGRCLIEDAPPGEHAVSATTPEGLYVEGKVTVPEAGLGRAELVFPDLAYRIRAVVCDGEGKPVGGITVGLSGKGVNAEALVDQRGQAEFRAPPGTYDLTARRGRQQWTTQVRLPEVRVAGDLVEVPVPMVVPRD